MQLLQDPKQSNVGDLNNLKREASRQFGNKKTECLKGEMEEHETNSTIKISGTCIGLSVTLKRAITVELI